MATDHTKVDDNDDSGDLMTALVEAIINGQRAMVEGASAQVVARAASAIGEQRDAIEQRIYELTNALGGYREALYAMEARAETAEGARDVLTQEVESLRDERSELAQEVARLSRDYGLLSAKRDALEQEIAQLRG